MEQTSELLVDELFEDEDELEDADEGFEAIAETAARDATAAATAPFTFLTELERLLGGKLAANLLADTFALDEDDEEEEDAVAAADACGD